MARVVCLHGVGSQQLGEEQLLKDWLPALQDGLTRAGAPGLLGSGDVAMAFYGDLFLPPRRTLAGADPFFSAPDVEPGWETDALMAWWAQAAEVEPQVMAPAAEGTLGGISISVQSALIALSQSRFFAGLAERALIFDLKQVRRYLTQPGLRAAARARLRALIGADTVAVVAHSLGSVVAYETLCALPDHGVRALITLGSPLGIRNLIFDQLDPAPADGIGAWPGSDTLSWTNIADRTDIVALVKDLRPRFGARVVCQLVPNGSHAHDATHYLGKRETGAALSAVLR
ncbi:hypothetical protein ACPCBX_14425 [Streptomyces tuirus]|uniref:Esterase n=1 Tax=Streptomyces tuirus TaxID=68278 RepID=A0A7G1NI51_9ACTN|nr:hypothetical protein [Streptomyces tuirus]BCL21324.1 hypothetical protein GCM10017668_31670 [Streptomyces tuirus]